MGRKTKVFSIVIGLAALYLLFSWFYPYSALSLNPFVHFKADPIVAAQYKNDLKEFKGQYEPVLVRSSNLEPEPTVARTQYILQMFDQSWLTDNRSTAITKHTLGNMLLDVKEAREIILLLAFEETYTPNTKIYLKMLLDQTYKLEEEIKDIQLLSNLHSRSTLERQLRNLHVSYISNFQHLTSFYEEYLRSKKEA